MVARAASISLAAIHAESDGEMDTLVAYVEEQSDEVIAAAGFIRCKCGGSGVVSRWGPRGQNYKGPGDCLDCGGLGWSEAQNDLA